MTRKQHHDRTNGYAILFQVMFFLILSSLVFFSCTSRRHLSGKDQKTVYLEKELAEANQRIEELYHRVSVIQFMVDTHEKAIQELETTPSGKKRSKGYSSSSRPVPNPGSSSGRSLSESPEDLYNQGRKAYNTKNYRKASSLFASISKSYPHHDLADNAIYWQGEALYAEKKFKGAIDCFKEMLQAYPDSNKAPDAMLKTGFSYLSIGDKKNAKAYLKKVTRNYPFSGAATKAADMLKTLNR